MPDLQWNADDVARIAGGDLRGDGNRAIQKVVTDSRGDVRDALYVALRGERFDGHAFLKDVAKGGGTAALVERPEPSCEIPQVVVKDTLETLQTLARNRRQAFEGPVVGITGSSGKTTTRKLVASILAQKYDVHQPIKNFNNHIGVPLTVLDLEKHHEAAVLELGCSDFGEIEILTRIARPDVALVTNVGPAHLEKLIDLDGVARAKGELFESVNKDSVAVVNVDDPRVAAMPLVSERRITFGLKEGAEVRLVTRHLESFKGQRLVIDIGGVEVEAICPLIGAHNAINATAAVAVATALGMEAEQVGSGLAAVVPEAGRLCTEAGPAGSLVIDDTYNANPASTRAALAVLTEMAAGNRRIACIGDMLELGERSAVLHVGIGEQAASLGLEILVTHGEQARSIAEGAQRAGMAGQNKHVESRDEAVAFIKSVARQSDTILVKGSRGMEMDRIVDGIVAEDANGIVKEIREEER